jgi:hypothetical protein
MASRWPLRVALALSCVGAVSGCGEPADVACSAGSPCPDGSFCNFDRDDGGMCEGCDGECDCGLPSRGETECNTVCSGGAQSLGPKTGTGGCCCGAFLGVEIQSSTDCAGGQMCANTDLACCVHLYSSDGVCNEQQPCFCDDGLSVNDGTSDRGCTQPGGMCYNVTTNEQCVAGDGLTGEQPAFGWDWTDCVDCEEGDFGCFASADEMGSSWQAALLFAP